MMSPAPLLSSLGRHFFSEPRGLDAAAAGRLYARPEDLERAAA
jgi:hypothetical protein